MKDKVKVIFCVVIGGTAMAVLVAWLASFCVAPFAILNWLLGTLVQ